MSEGSCREHDPELFDTDVQVAARKRAAEARRICLNECPVLPECLRYALVHEIMFGIWGGTSPEHRAGILRSPRRLARILGDGDGGL
jgi:WhiB family redox-sensing transcriptional regulator